MTGRIPAVIGRYEVIDLLGEGGMGVVYRGRDPRIGRVVAIKVLRVDSDDLRFRFEREARSSGNLSHSNIVTIFDYGEHEGQPFIVMEFVEGVTLAQQIAARAPMSTAAKLDLMEMLASGLGYAHRQGVVHRDIKPANLMIDRYGVLKILDFGIARIEDSSATKAGTMVGTPNYMSPEQVQGRVLDARSDIFSVGAVFYELLSYQQAFVGESLHGILDQVLHVQPDPLAGICPGLDPAIVAIVTRALEKDPADRYQTLGQLRLDLERCRAKEAGGIDAAGSLTLAGPVPHAPAGPTPRSDANHAVTPRRQAQEIEAHLNAAIELFNAEKFEQAIAEAQHASRLDPDEPRAREIENNAREALNKKSAADLIAQSGVLVQRGELALAEDLLAEALRLDPNAPQVTAIRREIATARDRERRREQEAEEEARRRRREAEDTAYIPRTPVPAEPTAAAPPPVAPERPPVTPPRPPSAPQPTPAPEPPVASAPSRRRALVALAVGAVVVLAAAASWRWIAGRQNQVTQPPVTTTISATLPATTTIAATTTITPGGDDPAADIRQRLHRLGPTARWQDVLAPLVDGLRLKPADAEFTALLGDLNRRAQAAAIRARDDAEKAGARELARTEYGQASARFDEAARLKDSQPSEAIHKFWEAVDLFQLARLHAKPVTTTSVVVPETTTSVVPLTTTTIAPATTTTIAPATTSVPFNPQGGDEAAIQRLLAQYESAYTSLDAAAVARLVPGVSEADMRRGFSGYQQYQLRVTNVRIELHGDDAVVTCVRSIDLVQRRGGRQPHRDTPTTIKLRRSGRDWIITSIQ